MNRIGAGSNPRRKGWGISARKQNTRFPLPKISMVHHVGRTVHPKVSTSVCYVLATVVGTGDRALKRKLPLFSGLIIHNHTW